MKADSRKHEHCQADEDAVIKGLTILARVIAREIAEGRHLKSMESQFDKRMDKLKDVA